MKDEAVRAVNMFKAANSNYLAAKEMIRLAEQNFTENRCAINTAWQEHLNHANEKVRFMYCVCHILHLIAVIMTRYNLKA